MHASLNNILFSRDIGGVGSHFSLDEREFKLMVDAVRIAKKMLGKSYLGMEAKILVNRECFRSLFIERTRAFVFVHAGRGGGAGAAGAGVSRG